MNWRRLLLGLLLAPPVLAGSALWWLLDTESGTRWSLQRLADQLPGLSVQGVNGTWLSDLRVARLSYADPAVDLALSELSLDWLPAALLRGAVNIQSLQAASLSVTLKDAAPAAPDEPLVIPEIRSPWPVAIQRLALAELLVSRGTDTWRFAELGTALRLDGEGLNLDRLGLQGEGARLSGGLHLGAIAPHAVTGRMAWELAREGLPALSGELRAHGDLERLLLETDLQGDIAARVAATLQPDLAEGRHRFAVQADWTRLTFALGEDLLQSDQGSIGIEGQSQDYRLRGQAHFDHPAAGRMTLRLEGQGTDRQLQIADGRLQGQAGRLAFTGNLAWAPALAWTLSLDGRDIDPGAYLAAWPGNIALRAALDGRLVDSEPTVALQIDSLQGMLRGYPVSARGSVQLSDGRWRLAALAVESGPNRVRLDGTLLPQLALEFDIDAPQLQAFAPQLAGTLHGRGRASGSLQRLAVEVDAQGTGLQLGDARADRFTLQGRLDPNDATASRWQLLAAGLAVGGEAIDELRLDGTGNMATHRVDGALRSPLLTAQWLVSGALREQTWQGELERAELQPAQLGQWALQAPVPLRIDEKGQRLGTLCLVQDTARLCTEGQRDARGRLDLAGEWRQLPLALLQPWLTVEAELTGEASGRFRLQGMPDSAYAEADMTVSPGRLRIRPEAGPEVVTDHHDGRLSLRLSADRLHAQGGVLLGSDGRVQGELRVAGQRVGGRSLAGELTLDLADPAPLALFLPQLTELAGPLQLQGRWQGTTAQPRLALAGSWQDGRFGVPALGITLSELDLRIDGDGDRLDLKGRARSGPGEVRIAGELQLDAAAGWPLRLQVDGENFTVARRADIEARMSPALTISSRRGRVEAQGQVTVPYARLTGKELRRGAVRASEDEVIVDGPAASAASSDQTGLQVLADLLVVLGDQVSLDAYGLTGRLTGEVRLHQRPGVPPQGNGQLDVVDGRYKAYGQDLTIEQGRLLFAGPLENPDVDVRAVRKAGTVTAGILLGGSLKAPTVQLFSEPAMDQTAALSYLMTGGPPGASSAISPLMLTEAALGLGLDKSGEFTGQLAGSVGLDEFGVESGAAGLESSMLAIGKQLSPDIYLRYLYGLFDSTAAVQIRYRLSDRLRLEVEEGQQRAADLIYEFERD